MQYWALFVGELFLLFFTSKSLIRSLSVVLFRIFRSKRVVVTFIAILFFPGVVIHELAHFLMAGIVFVKAHEISLVPKIEGDHVQLGHVQITKTDIVRSLLIGLAPVLLGGALLLVLGWYVLQDISLDAIFSSYGSVIKYVIFLYGFFVITNTMFSSKKDVEGGVLLLGVILFILGSLQFAGARVDQFIISNLNRPFLIDAVKSIVVLLAIPVGINVFFTLLFAGVNKRMH